MTNDLATKAGTTLEHRIGPRGRFVLHQSAGDVAIRGVEGDTVRVRSLDGRPLADLFSIETGDASLELRQVEKLGIGIFSRREGAELEIDVPHGANVSIDTQSADIAARDLSGQKAFRSASGEIALTRFAGPVDVESVSGEIQISGLAPVDVTAKSVSGEVDVRVPSVRRLSLGTTSGDIRLDAGMSGDGPFAIRTISGDVIVVGRGGFRVEAESITGDLTSDLPSRRESVVGRKVLLIGRPGPTLSFRSVSGDFHVAEPRDAAPEVDAEAAARVEVPAAPEPPEPPSPPAPPAAPGGATRPTPAGAAVVAATAAAAAIDAEAHRLTILRALERGDITVAEATDRLSRLDDEVTR
jgi:hypothetical protein